MQCWSLQNILITAINPILQSVIKKYDVDCEKDGSLLNDSLGCFLGKKVHLCDSCSVLDYRVAKPFYQAANRFMRLDPKFMRG